MKSWIELFKTDPLAALRTTPLSVWLVLTALGALFIIFAGENSSGEVQQKQGRGRASSLDTFIPEGHVLIPIELENYDSVDSILGSYGVVDLYVAGTSDRKKSLPLVRRIKILRAPQNPSQFAVLVPEQQASIFFKSDSVFFAAIQNPRKAGTHFENKPTNKPRLSRQVLVFESE